MNKEYYICGKAVVEKYKPEEVSKPLIWLESEVYVAVLDFPEIEKYYNENEDSLPYDFWANQLVAGTMDVSKLTLKKLKRENLFYLIEEKTGLTANRNIAMTIHNICARESMTGIEFFNLLYSYQ